MALMNFTQIKDLEKLRSHVDLLMTSYEAAKVLTRILKDDSEEDTYTVEEMLIELKDKLDAIAGSTGEEGEAGSLSLTDLKDAVDALGDRKIQAFTGIAETPIEEYALKDLPDDALLHRAELDITSYQSALDALTTKLADNESLIDTIKSLIGNDKVSDLIDKAIADLQAEVNKIAEQTDIDDADEKANIIDSKVTVLENGEKEVVDVISIVNTNDALPLSETPNDKEVRLYINGAIYYENDEFTVSRILNEATWTFTKDAGGFDLTVESTPKVTAKYFA